MQSIIFILLVLYAISLSPTHGEPVSVTYSTDDVAQIIRKIPKDDSPSSNVDSTMRFEAQFFSRRMVPSLLAILRDEKFKSVWSDAIYALGVICSDNKGVCSAQDIITWIDKRTADQKYFERVATYYEGYVALARLGSKEAIAYLKTRAQPDFWRREDLAIDGLKIGKEEAIAEYQTNAILALGRLDEIDRASTLREIAESAFSENPRLKEAIKSAAEGGKSEDLLREARRKHRDVLSRSRVVP